MSTVHSIITPSPRPAHPAEACIYVICKSISRLTRDHQLCLPFCQHVETWHGTVECTLENALWLHCGCTECTTWVNSQAASKSSNISYTSVIDRNLRDPYHSTHGVLAPCAQARAKPMESPSQSWTTVAHWTTIATTSSAQVQQQSAPNYHQQLLAVTQFVWRV